MLWDHDDDNGYRRMRDGIPSAAVAPPYVTISRRHSIYSGSDSSSSSDDSGPDFGPKPDFGQKRFPTSIFTKKRIRKPSMCLKADSCAFLPNIPVFTTRLEFLKISLENSELDGALPLLAYLLEPVQRVMRYPLLIKNLKFVLMRSRQGHALIGSADHVLEITEQLAIITNLTQPFKPISEPENKKSEKKPSRRRFEFMRQFMRLRAR